MASIVATVLPDRAGVSLAINFVAEGATQVSVGRNDPDGFSYLLRAGDKVTLSAGLATVEDFEAPLDVPVSYVATKVTPAPPPAASATSAVVTIPSNDLVWLKDPAYPSRNMVVPIVTSIPQLLSVSRAGVFPILDRAAPIVVANRRQLPTGTLTIHTLTDGQRQQVADLMARGSVVMLQANPSTGWGSRYIHVTDVTEARVGLVSEPARRWSMPFLVVDRPEGLSVAATTAKTWASVKAIYPTWADLKATAKTWEQLLEDGP